MAALNYETNARKGCSFPKRLLQEDHGSMVNRANFDNSGVCLSAVPHLNPTYHCDEPRFDEQSKLWMLGNVRNLKGVLACVPDTFGGSDHPSIRLEAIETEAERLVLDGKVLVAGIHNPSHQRAAIVPLRWGAPRILVMSGGFKHHLGDDLKEEPFPAARLWRYQWDHHTDLAISRRAPDKKPTGAKLNLTVDRLIAKIVAGEVPGLLFERPEILGVTK